MHCETATDYFLNISIKPKYSTAYFIKILPTDNIKTVKQLIFQREDVDVDDQLIFYNGKELEDDSLTIEAVGLTDKSRLVFDIKKFVLLSVAFKLNFRENIKVKVLTIDHKLFDIEINSNATVCNLSEKIRLHLKLHHCGITVMVRSAKVNDCKTLKSVGIMDGSFVSVVERLIESFKPILVYEKSASRNASEKWQMWFCPGHLVSDLREEVANELCMETRSVKLESNNCTLTNDEADLSSCGVIDTCTVFYTLIRGYVIVKRLDNTTTKINVDVDAKTVLDLKGFIYQQMEIPVRRQKLYLSSIALSDEDSLLDKGISDGCQISLRDVVVPDFVVSVKTLEGSQKSISVGSQREQVTMEDLRNAIYREFDVEPACQKLVFNGKMLSTDANVCIGDMSLYNSVIFMVPRNRTKIKITVRDTRSSKTIHLEIDRQATVLDLKQLTQQHLASLERSCKRIRFEVNSIELVNDTQLLSSYDITDETIVTLHDDASSKMSFL